MAAVKLTIIFAVLCCFYWSGQAIKVQNIPNEYIVVLKKSGEKYRDHSLAAICNNLVGVHLIKEYKILNRRVGYIRAGVNVPASLQSHPLVDHVEPNQRVQYVLPPQLKTLARVSAKSSTSAGCLHTVMGSNGWAPTRTSYRDRPFYSNDPYIYGPKDNGTDVRIYVLDTGIDLKHVDFAGRAVWGMAGSTVQNESQTDENGHGTNVAGIAGGGRFGVAQNATLVSCKVIGSDGYAVTSDIIQALVWVIADVKKREAKGSKPRAVINMSLGGPGRAFGLEVAVRAATSSGIPVIIAAGNENDDACDYSPARITSAITVGATASNDSLASFSNYGHCVDILAPGVNVAGPWIDTPGAQASGFPSHSYYTRVSGTSQATPIVSGIIARHLSSMTDAQFKDLIPATVTSIILDSATIGKVNFPNPTASWETPNRLVYKECGEYNPQPPPTSSNSSANGRLNSYEEDDDEHGTASSLPGLFTSLMMIGLCFFAYN